jgi:hypothetical protein
MNKPGAVRPSPDDGDDHGNVLLKKAFGDFYFLAEGIDEFLELLVEPRA